MKAENFESYGEPTNDCVRVIGRVINISNEDIKLKESCVGIIYTGEDTSNGVRRLTLNLSEIQSYSLFEGEIIVAEGFKGSNDKFNANRIYKP